MNPADGEATKIEPRVDGLAGISLQSKTEEDLHSSGLEDLLRLRPQQKPAEDLQSLIATVDRTSTTRLRREQQFMTVSEQ